MKNYFYFLLEWADTFNALTDLQSGRLIKAMVEYERTGGLPDLMDDVLLDFAWKTNILPKMKTMQEHYRETVAKRSAAGKASATKRTNVNKCEQVLTSVNKAQQNEQKPTDIDLDLDIDKDLDIDNKKEKNNKKEKAVKHKYGLYQNVLLTDREMEKLKAEFADWQERIENVSAYCQSHGKTYRDYLATIRNWARRDSKPVVNTRNDVTAGYQQAMRLLGGGNNG